jgi:hypothetical protein
MDAAMQGNLGDNNSNPVELIEWRNQIRKAARCGLRQGYLLSAFAVAMGCLIVIIYIGPEVPVAAQPFFREGRGWLPLLSVALVLLGIDVATFIFDDPAKIEENFARPGSGLVEGVRNG